MSGCDGGDGSVSVPCALTDLMSSNVSSSSPGNFDSLHVRFQHCSERMFLQAQMPLMSIVFDMYMRFSLSLLATLLSRHAHMM